MRRIRRLAPPVVALSIVVTACTINGSDSVEEVDPGLLNGLNELTESTTVTTSPESTTPESTEPGPSPTSGDSAPPSTSIDTSTTTTVATEDMTAYFIAGSRLLQTSVPVAEGAGLARRLRALERGPTEADVEQGARTALPAGLIRGLRIDDNAVTVHLNGEPFASVDPDDHRLMIGQIVMTLTARPNGIDDVDFTLDGEPLAVFRDDNTQTAPGEMVTEDDYEVLVGPETDRTAAPTTAASDSSVSR